MTLGIETLAIVRRDSSVSTDKRFLRIAIRGSRFSI
jgi:hypothetical protein